MARSNGNAADGACCIDPGFVTEAATATGSAIEADALAWASPDPPQRAKRERGSPERGAQVAVVDFLRLALPGGSMVAAVTNEHAASAKTKRGRQRFGEKRKRQGVMPGFPDLLALLPCAPRIVLVEMKAPRGGRLSPAQIDRHRELAAMGFAVIVARSVEEARAGLLGLGIALRRSRLDGDPL